VTSRRAVHMAVVHGRTSLCCCDRDLFRTVDRRGRIGLDELAHVGVRRRAGGGREPRHCEELRRVGARCVAHEHADAECAVRELGAEQVQPPRELG
jgi:hypothetical protein